MPGQARVHVAVLDNDLGAHGLQALDVLVHGARTDGAAAGQRHAGLAESCQQRAQGQDRGAHGLDQFVGCLGVGQKAGVDAHGAAVIVLGADTHVADELEHGGHVLQARHIAQGDGLGRQQRGAQLGQGGILGAGDRHLAMQRSATANQEFVHG